MELMQIFITLDLRHLPSLIHHLSLLILILLAVVVLRIGFLTCTVALLHSLRRTSFARIVGLLSLHDLHLLNKIHVYGRQILLLLQLFFGSLLSLDQLLYSLMELRVFLYRFVFYSFLIQHLHQFWSRLENQVVNYVSSFIHPGLFQLLDFLVQFLDHIIFLYQFLCQNEIAVEEVIVLSSFVLLIEIIHLLEDEVLFMSAAGAFLRLLESLFSLVYSGFQLFYQKDVYSCRVSTSFVLTLLAFWALWTFKTCIRL